MRRLVLAIVLLLALVAPGAPARAQELTFVEAEIVPAPPPSACPTVSLGDVAVSADGRHVYAVYDVCIGDDQIAIFARAARGALAFVGFEPVPGGNPSGLALAADGSALFYVTNNGQVAALRRDPASGLLAVADVENDGAGGVQHILFARDVAVSPDGRHVYVVGQENAVTTFGWDDAAGALSLVDADVNGEGDVVLALPDHVLVSPDGNFVFTASSSSDDLAVWLRDPATGALDWLERFVEGAGGVVTGLDGVAGLAAARTTVGGTVETASLYAASAVTGAVARFDQGSPAESPPVAFGEATPVVGPPGAGPLAVHPDGARLYVTDSIENRIAVVARDSVTGVLGAVLGGIGNGDPGVSGLTQPRSLAVSADGRNLYATSSFETAIAVLHVPEAGGGAAAAGAALAALAGRRGRRKRAAGLRVAPRR